MKILLTNNHLERLGGSETWVYTMAQELKRRGYQVGVYTKVKGYVSDLLKDLIDDNPKDYDLALINHNTCLDVDAKYKIFTSHGTVPELERPIEGADYYVAVNENVAEKYNLETIIKNPIDTELFKPITEIKDKPETILAITEEKLDLPYNVIYPDRHTMNMPELINKADIVISLGRGCLEAMSCGRPVITYDKRPYWEARGDGYLDDLGKLKGNVAGEYLRTDIKLEEEIKKYKKEDGKINREYILENHDVRKIVDKYLEIYELSRKVSGTPETKKRELTR
jgi:hypothetical protein